MAERKIFKTLIPVEEALKRLREHYKVSPVGKEEIPVSEAYGRVLVEDVVSGIDVPGFDRATMDGYAVRASDTFGAEEDHPAALRVTGVSQPGFEPTGEVGEGEAVEVGTGAPIPRGANAVVMVEYTQTVAGELKVSKPVSPGENIMPAGSDMMIGELVLRTGQRLSPRELGVLAALGRANVKVYRKPRVAIISTGNELAEPGVPLKYAQIYDINASAIAAAVAENGGVPIQLGIVRDDREAIRRILDKALKQADIILTSGSTSAGAGDIIYQILGELGPPGILAHGLTVKPGKPTILAVAQGKPIIGLPGYPTSALMIFNLMAAPIIREMAALPEAEGLPVVEAKAAVKIFSAKGRRELLPVHVVSGKGGVHLVYPVGSGSGAITTMAFADGYIDIPQNQEFVDEGEVVPVRLFSSELRPADLVMIGSHCLGVEVLMQLMRRKTPSLSFKIVNTGSLGGFHAAGRGEADLAGVHMLDEDTGEYNAPFLKRLDLVGKVRLVRGYVREQGLIVAKGNPKGIRGFDGILRGDVTFINRNAGSGTRILTDLKLKDAAAERGLSFDDLNSSIKGYYVEAKSHSAVAAAVAQGRADVGVGIRPVAHLYNLDFIHVSDEYYDFLVPGDRVEKIYVRRFFEVLKSSGFQEELNRRVPGIRTTAETGNILVDVS